MSEYESYSIEAEKCLKFSKDNTSSRRSDCTDINAKVGIGFAILALAAAIKESAATKKEE
ncbi:MAG: hypothetical protein WCT26_04695 [Candidatus Buchananbacteria bacterium]|jgi:hypothetical protein